MTRGAAGRPRGRARRRRSPARCAGPRGAASAARPAPWRAAATPASGRADWTSRRAHRRRAEAPAARPAGAARGPRPRAAAALVPVRGAVWALPSTPRPGPGRSRSTAGATRSGFWRPSAVGPHEENDATPRAPRPPDRGARRDAQPRLGLGEAAQRRALAGAEPDHREGQSGVARDGREAPPPSSSQMASARRARRGGAAGRLGDQGVAARHHDERAQRAARPVRPCGSPRLRRPRRRPASSRSATTGHPPPAGSGAHQGKAGRGAPRRARAGRRGGPCAGDAGRHPADREHRRRRGRARRPSRAGRRSGRRCRPGATTVEPTRSAAPSALATGSIASRRRSAPGEAQQDHVGAVGGIAVAGSGSTACSSAASTRSVRARARCARRPAPAATTR